MTVAEGGASHFDHEASVALDRELAFDGQIVRQMQRDMGHRIADLITISARKLDALGIFPTVEVVSIPNHRDGGYGEATPSTQPLVILGHVAMEEPVTLPNGYTYTGDNIAVDPEGRISNRMVYEKDGVALTSAYAATFTGPDTLYAMGEQAIEALASVNRTAMQKPQRP